MNIHCVGDAMSKRGWSLNSLQRPASVHICCTVKHIGNEQKFLDDLVACVAEIREQMLDPNRSTKLHGN